ncbi:hypothetical protein AB205_0198160, partial [Aquarana catesbeiana]
MSPSESSLTLDVPSESSFTLDVTIKFLFYIRYPHHSPPLHQMS